MSSNLNLKKISNGPPTQRLEEALNIIIKAKNRSDLRETWKR